MEQIINDSKNDKRFARLFTYYITDTTTLKRLVQVLDTDVVNSFLEEVIENMEKVIPFICEDSKQKVQEKLHFYEQFCEME